MDYTHLKPNEWCIQIPKQYINSYDQIIQLVNTMDKKPNIKKIDYADRIILEFVFENQSQNLLFLNLMQTKGIRISLSIFPSVTQ